MTMMGNATHQPTAVTKSGLVNQQLKLMKLGARRPLISAVDENDRCITWYSSFVFFSAMTLLTG